MTLPRRRQQRAVGGHFACALAACFFAACDGDRRESPAPDLPADTTVAAPAETPLPADVPSYGAYDLDSLRARMDSVEAALARAPRTERPQLLLQLGRLKRLYLPHGGTAPAAYAEARPDEYYYNEIAGSWLYQGKQLRAVIDSFPNSDLVDDAAYELTLLLLGGECEGFVTCYIASTWQQVRPFLMDYPTSPYAPRALDRIIAAFEDNLKDVRDLSTATESYDPKELRPLIAEFDAVAEGLPPALRQRAQATIARVRQRLVTQAVDVS